MQSQLPAQCPLVCGCMACATYGVTTGDGFRTEGVKLPPCRFKTVQDRWIA